MRVAMRVAVLLSTTGLWAACDGAGGLGTPAEGGATTAAPTTESAKASASEVVGTGFGDPIPGLTAAEQDRFQAGKTEFTTTEDAADGLGPVFNDNSCGACHSVPATGGGNPRLETRFGTRTSNNKFDPLTSLGGSLIQEQGIGIAGDCNFSGELVPSQATLVSKRRSTALFGLGLVNALDDSTIRQLAAKENGSSHAEAGHFAQVKDIAQKRIIVGRFGWKNQVPTLHQFSGDAYVNEMGFTSPDFPDENCPGGDCAAVARCNPAPGLNDDGTDVRLFEDFMTMLGPPPRGTITAGVTRGEAVFKTLACANCHTETLTTGGSPIGALANKTFHPYSDFLLHDMGSLGDGIELGDSKGNEFRTAPLWGVSHQTTFLHDGRASSITAAIQAHDGQGARARDAFAALSAAQKADLLEFLNSL